MKLARGGLTDLDFIAQSLVLAHASENPSLIGLSTERTFVEAQSAGLLASADARALIEGHAALNAIFQWQRLMIEERFDGDLVPPVILKRLSSVLGLPDVGFLTSMQQTSEYS